MNVLIIPEDFRKDQYMLKPIISALFSEIGGSAKIRVCQDPLLGGIGQAMKWERINEIIDRYKGMIKLFLLCVDRDGIETRKQALTNLENLSSDILPDDKALIAENAWQEIEVWVLAGHDLPGDWSWQDLRNEPNPKELYFEPFAKEKNVFNEPGEGRKSLAIAAAGKYKRIKTLCPKLAEMEKRIKQKMEAIP